VQIHFLLIVDIPFLVSQQLFPCWFSHQPSKERIEYYFDVPSYLFYTVGIMSFTLLPGQSADRLRKRWRLKTIERIFFSFAYRLVWVCPGFDAGQKSCRDISLRYTQKKKVWHPNLGLTKPPTGSP
jgi:hypothetical protein